MGTLYININQYTSQNNTFSWRTQCLPFWSEIPRSRKC